MALAGLCVKLVGATRYCVPVVCIRTPLYCVRGQLRVELEQSSRRHATWSAESAFDDARDRGTPNINDVICGNSSRSRRESICRLSRI